MDIKTYIEELRELNDGIGNLRPDMKTAELLSAYAYWKGVNAEETAMAELTKRREEAAASRGKVEGLASLDF